ncbi:CPBP family intramembrane metalloprotease [Micromonospora sp. WMMD1102]|uniref:CPBP family intramembrane glutamic endopeptidase n=1 Tax=Micromonospora sp. WMMD1102 TaxID=3016105 RepID=UPI002414D30B|nr:CPBP family intramembrane glutamic endopeptidase [Micromonospora sp. WMMD1102]MDG4786608.1 CPBP family intramembrane metalloprotease [Micromonospora sp. WMMD1102]
MRRRIFTALGLALLISAAAALALFSGFEVRTSADPEAPTKPLAGIVAATLVGLLLVRLVPLRLPAMPPAEAAHRPVLRRQVVGLTAVALLLSALVLAVDPGIWYGPVKLVLFLGGTALLLRLYRTDWRGGRAHRRDLPTRWYWLGPLPALLGWAYLLYYSPLAGSEDVSGYRQYDRVYLLAAMLLTFVTASLAEEIFYRAVLQTRLEALYGRWPAIVATSLLFAAMHTHRIGDGPLWEVVAVILAWNGGFGLLAGYLWARYRNLWAVVALHTAVNSLSLLPLLVG